MIRKGKKRKNVYLPLGLVALILAVAGFSQFAHLYINKEVIKSQNEEETKNQLAENQQLENQQAENRQTEIYQEGEAGLSEPNTGNSEGVTLDKKIIDTTEIETKLIVTQSKEQKELLTKDSFRTLKISKQIFKRIDGKSYKKDCDIPLEDLRLVKVLYYGFDGEVHEGEIIVNAKIASKVVKIFKELYEIQYPIEKIELVDEYDADDEKSMAANNSSCFNYRKIDGKKTLSNHSQGIAIDINPLYNPYVRKGQGERDILPVEGKKYAERSLDCPYYIKKGDAINKIFKKYGFTWGGDWKNSKDYQHFEIKIN